MKELVCNLHIHSTYSDGTGNYQTIANAALKNSVDVIIITDHNILVKGVEGYRSGFGKQVLMLTGEEVHDQSKDPQINHMLVLGANKEVAAFAYDPQLLIGEVEKAGGLTFLAHPFEFALPLFRETAISWESWDVEGFTGLELWNGLSELKTVVHTLADALYYGFMPELMAHAPLKQTLAKWDELLKSGKRMVAVGGSDAHSLHFRRGLFKKTIFPYAYHFSAINNHLLVPEFLTGDLEHDKSIIYQALRTGSSFVGYDLAASTKGFSFTIENESALYSMGDSVDITGGATIRILLPQFANIRLIHNGNVIHEQNRIDRLIYTISEPGTYRVECSIHFMGKKRGWIYSNPIYTFNSKMRKLI
ncbi:MAG: hypothetical protein FD147_782 [Chloroflexi bacterium]|nr:MAG: hypothetical protein FD147_782 [Chloroflexota bacterium]